jgi:hypothetical protein
MLQLLASVAPERTAEEWSKVPFGAFCRALFRFRSVMFGPLMPGVVSCSECGARLEFSFACDGLDIQTADLSSVRIEWANRAVDIRLPTAADLLSSHSAGELLSRCSTGQADATSACIEAASARVAEADPLAETMLDLTCPSCGYRWQALLDIVSYLSREISHHARRLLGEVHRLASAYGWGEQEILALSANRRRTYLEMAGA